MPTQCGFMQYSQTDLFESMTETMIQIVMTPDSAKESHTHIQIHIKTLQHHQHIYINILKGSEKQSFHVHTEASRTFLGSMRGICFAVWLTDQKIQ